VKPVEIKIAHIGGGSRYWARDLLGELALSHDLTGSIALYDIDHPAAQLNVAIANAIFSRPEARARFAVRAVRTMADALRGADFVILSIEPGPTRARYADLIIPEKHGVWQSVGDTTGPGGIVRALRAIPLYLEFARQIDRYCPRAWVINYTNPMTLCTAALYAETPRIRAFGCCHEVFHSQKVLAKYAAQWGGLATPPARQEIKIDLTGLNHFTWITQASWRGTPLLPRLRQEIARPGFFRSRADTARAAKRSATWFRNDNLIAFDLFRRFGALAAAGDRHLAEFVPFYLQNEAALARWGILLTPYEWRLTRASLRNYDAAHYARIPLKPSQEEGVKLIEALVGRAPIDTNVNLPNRGQSPDLPLGHIVETNARFRRDRVSAVKSSALPPGAHALVSRIISVQNLTLQAAVAKDRELAFQAVLLDPLMRLPTDEAWKMFSAMLDFVRPQLPGWK
jgi:alpha-galactosidase